ncbi:MAG: aminomethyl-transferring glycine dehydrogenase subunit GcvPB [Candidatus Fermentibacteraceae bacterium]|nr:aminomethyl-transferring glycine dehydrogenase subunit GcvPB [Candidatus Fermentibacteraceae bacterium]MBN2609579.1 aminomethyl-transferring glycine dehydrogenase subunit GcvPB [Candidatus Fermentibacteraceae bacterium]
MRTIFDICSPGRIGVSLPGLDVPAHEGLPENLNREGDGGAGLPRASEGQVMRHFINLGSMNYHLDKGMYPLGSCTMKYNPKLHENLARMEGLAGIHPLCPDSHVQGTLELMHHLGELLCEITGFQGVSLQPAAGAQGEFCGIMLIKSYHESRNEPHRNEVLMPDSAHGTNPATSTLADCVVVGVESNEQGLVDPEDLRRKAGPNTAAFMLTNPNTLGLFESHIGELTSIVHEAGGLNYMDGANMNALLGIARPGDMGFDVCHLNLHKTFSTPHGGGGPGSGPVACNGKLADFLPEPVVVREEDGSFSLKRSRDSFGRLLAFHGHIGVLYRAYAYIMSLGAEGLREVSEAALINANYLKARLSGHFDNPFDHGPCMHEFVLSGDRQAKLGVKTLDIAKRLLDYGIHAPTVYFPLIVHEALMIEPTETEGLEELDRFVEAMISIAKEAEEKPHLVTDAPVNTPVLRLDEVKAVKDLCLVEPAAEEGDPE